jgi:hypothetical protein
MRETPFGQVRAVGFDLDDTLCVYMPVAVQARRAMMERYLAPQTGLPIETLDQQYKRAFHSVLEELHTERWYPLYLREGSATRTETFRRLLATPELGRRRAGRAHQRRVRRPARADAAPARGDAGGAARADGDATRCLSSRTVPPTSSDASCRCWGWRGCSISLRLRAR